MSNDQKMISIEPIPLTKLTVVINNFIANTITHLNKLSVKVKKSYQNLTTN